MKQSVGNKREEKGLSVKRKTADMPLPSDEKIADLARLLLRQEEQKRVSKGYARVKDVLTLLGVGTVLGLSLISPTAALLAKPFLDAKKEREANEWKRFNRSYLRRTIERMHQEKLVEIREQQGEQVVELTAMGKRRIIKCSLETLSVETPKSWDGRWRMVLYDVPHGKKHLRDVFRQALLRLGFYQLQESVWIYPYPCEKQVSFLREYYGVGNEVVYAVATTLEDDDPYRTYFGI